MTKNVEVDNSKVLARLKKLAEGLEGAPKLMGEIGSFLVASMLKRTSQGLDVEGIPFDAYSVPYAKFRESIDLPTDKVDLFFTGQMLEKLTYEETGKQVKLFFTNTPRRGYKGGKEKVSNSELAFYNNETREFFAISSEEEKTILEMVEDYVRDLLRK